MEDTIYLIQQSHMGDKEAREKLVENNMGLVWSIVRRFMGRGYDAEDLFQIGSIGLLKAIDKFDLSMDVKLSTYAVPLITGEIKRFLRDDGMIKVSRQIKENSWKIRKTAEKISNREGREATVEEIANEAGIAREEIALALEASMEVESIYRPVTNTEGKEMHLIDKIIEEKNYTEQCINSIVVKQLIDSLESKEAELIKLRYFEDKTQNEIAKILGMNQVQVSRLEKKILLKLRKFMN